MNLYFKIKDSSGHLDFPWQTSTKTTYAVLDAKTNKEKLEILRKSISDWEESVIKERIAQVKALLESEYLQLAMI